MRIIGLLGKKGSGKGTAAAALADIGYKEIAFADPLYKEVAEAFNIPVDMLKSRGTKETPLPALKLTLCKDSKFYGIASKFCLEAQQKGGVGGWMVSPLDRHFYISPRVALQLWGTEYRRADDNFYWVKQLAATVDKLKSEGWTRICISDVREAMEAAWVKRRDNGLVLKIVRPNNPYENHGTAGHSSETEVDSIAYDIGVTNDSSMEDLSDRVLQAERSWFDEGK